MSTPDPASTAWLTVALEEYKALRTEVIEAIQAQRTIMQLGITGISVLLGVGIQQAPSFLATAILSLVIPIIAVFITTAAWGEYFRAARVSAFLSMREAVLNDATGTSTPAMKWESWLRQQPINIVSTTGQFFVLYILTIGAATSGFALMFAPTVKSELPVLAIVGIAIGASFLCGWALVRYRRFRRITEDQFRATTA